MATLEFLMSHSEKPDVLRYTNNEANTLSTGSSDDLPRVRYIPVTQVNKLDWEAVGGQVVPGTEKDATITSASAFALWEDNVNYDIEISPPTDFDDGAGTLTGSLTCSSDGSQTSVTYSIRYNDLDKETILPATTVLVGGGVTSIEPVMISPRPITIICHADGAEDGDEVEYAFAGDLRYTSAPTETEVTQSQIEIQYSNVGADLIIPGTFEEFELLRKFVYGSNLKLLGGINIK